jgi:hypothetical protein
VQHESDDIDTYEHCMIHDIMYIIYYIIPCSAFQRRLYDHDMPSP